jgi:hypothetical protein
MPPGQQATRRDKRVNRRYVVDEDGERVAVLLDIAEYERMVAQQTDEPPDDQDFDPEEGERRITEFITSADELPGPPVAELVDQVVELMRAAWSDVETVVSGRPRNKVLATQLSLSQQARGLQSDDPQQWRLFAATTLLSGMISKPPHSSDDT